MQERWIVTTVFVMAIGCAREQATSPPSAPATSRVNVTAPGVKVDVDKTTGNVEVVAPGAKIKVGDK